MDSTDAYVLNPSSVNNTKQLSGEPKHKKRSSSASSQDLVEAGQFIISSAQVKDFFEYYNQLLASYDPSVAELYADHAKIRTLRSDAKQRHERIAIDGAQWKPLIAEYMPEASKRGDYSSFSNIQIEELPQSEQGQRYKIRAQRYASHNCMEDSDYYMIVAPNKMGQLRIIEEQIQIKYAAQC